MEESLKEYLNAKPDDAKKRPPVCRSLRRVGAPPRWSEKVKATSMNYWGLVKSYGCVAGKIDGEASWALPISSGLAVEHGKGKRLDWQER